MHQIIPDWIHMTYKNHNLLIYIHDNNTIWVCFFFLLLFLFEKKNEIRKSQKYQLSRVLFVVLLLFFGM